LATSGAGSRARALAWATLVNVACALLFWIIVTVVGSPTFLSFWNRSLAGKIGLTLVFLVVGGRALVWYTRKLTAYAIIRHRGPIRLLPLGFGLGIFAMTVAWLGVTVVSEATYRAIRLLVAPVKPDFTILFLPIASFVQFLFSRSTLLWLLAGGIVWHAAARVGPSRRALLAYYAPLGSAGDPATATLAFVRTWNVLGYLVFILSLMFQS
jgi:hypothetical protein